MRAKVHYTDGSIGTFQVESVETVNDMAYLDGVMHTNVEDVEVSA